jgi:hypothetical protein
MKWGNDDWRIDGEMRDLRVACRLSAQLTHIWIVTQLNLFAVENSNMNNDGL